MISKTLFIGVAVIALAYIYNICFQQSAGSVETAIIQAWEDQLKKPVKTFSKIVIGLNSNVDLIVNGRELLEALEAKSNGVYNDHETLTSIQDIQETFANYFRKGAAVERPFVDGKVYQHIVEKAGKLDDHQWYIGGNAALMAETVASSFPLTKVQLIGPVGQRLHKLLNPSITVPKVSLTESDEVHLIMEYQIGEKWGNDTATVANRFITSYDEANGKMTMLDTFFKSIQEDNPDLVVLSGLHMMEGQKEEVWKSRVDYLAKNLQGLPRDLPVHLELASMANGKFIKYLAETLLRHVTSLGLNEQEITFVLEVTGSPVRNILDENERPRIDKVGDSVHFLLEQFGHSKSRKSSRLTRVHLHSLQFHVAGVIGDSWRNIESAVGAGTRMASLRACDLKSLTADKLNLKLPRNFSLHEQDTVRQLNSSQPIMSWSKGDKHFVFSPVLVCKKPLKTVGLGDAISATGLFYSEFNPLYYS
ncbi:ADP-dependent glucokinase-like [Lineus longissimus]|uniref:ADP-dependent glucokinase-like n=1 Tax=Lineus longissimus TaxID=88925 RepID=UPI002B4D1F65